MRDVPLTVVASWPYPNFVDPHTRGSALLIVNGLFISLVVIAVTLRLYTRLVIKRWFGSDDLFIIFALVCCILLLSHLPMQPLHNVLSLPVLSD
jgi:hypothetical protein